jgi:hypothetical protein
MWRHSALHGRATSSKLDSVTPHPAQSNKVGSLHIWDARTGELSDNVVCNVRSTSESDYRLPLSNQLHYAEWFLGTIVTKQPTPLCRVIFGNYVNIIGFWKVYKYLGWWRNAIACDWIVYYLPLVSILGQINPVRVLHHISLGYILTLRIPRSSEYSKNHGGPFGTPADFYAILYN